MNRFAILKGLPSPPPEFKPPADTIAQDMLESASIPPSVVQRSLERGRQTDTTIRVQLSDLPEPIRSQMVRPPRNLEDTFLSLTTPTGRHFRIGRDQIHIHHRRGNSGYNDEYELHLNLPNNLAFEILNDLEGDSHLRGTSRAPDLNPGPSITEQFMRQHLARVRGRRHPALEVDSSGIRLSTTRPPHLDFLPPEPNSLTALY